MAERAGALRSLLGLIEDDGQSLKLARDGGHAFVSSSLRPYAIAALAEIDEAARHRPTLVVVGDDRAARDLAGDLRAWLAPRRVRYYPSRGVAYESHLAPPAHLVGLRVAALDALLGGAQGPGGGGPGAGGDPNAHTTGAPVVVVSAVALSEKVPDPELRPHSFTLRVGELLDLDECAAELVGAGYERTDQVEERGQFALRGGLLDVFPATEERAVRVDMFDVEIESLRWFSTFTQRSLGEVDEVEIAPAAELAVEHRELAEIAAATGAFSAAGADGKEGERPDIAELLPVERFGALLDLVGDAELMVAAEEEIGPVLTDHWSDVCAAFGDEDAHHLYVNPESIHATLKERARIWLSALSSGQEIELRAQSADTAARSLGEAEPELEKLVRSGYRTVVAFPRHGEGERAAYNLGRLKATWLAEAEGLDVTHQAIEPSLRFATASLREGFVAPQLKLAVFPE
ncbi:MAG: transcription-repair coupling factor, partial [Solirubrobacteraceae bacterium]